ncbi:MAG: hypothetical protein HYV26_04875, partial [Candidatus Hydrogenedentes bacterium]|nr:hypothetical protein [Candidatus Hydrogenedentota bacterium]
MSERYTASGTPWAMGWDEEWAGVVEAEEAKVGHRICGARQVSGLPCGVVSEHATGRCRYHG